VPIRRGGADPTLGDGVVRVKGAADERAPAAVYRLDAVDLGDEL
jgi:hypothetical protein